MKVVLHPEAEDDLRNAASFYEREGSPALASRFIAEFRRLTALLAEYPEIGSPRANGRRGFSMSVFPYTLIYRATATEIRVLVVKHDGKRPDFGGARS